MFDILDGFVQEAENLMIAVMGVVAIGITAATWTRTRSWAPTLGAFILGAVVIYGVGNYDTLAGEVKKDVDTHRGVTVTVKDQ